ncbi:Neuroligin-4, X-linked [Triangularia setosa]|uniref:Neuroligin-4, X-linked n=1 Tax=Triangularia setosa TaxID=2587417 RepID=A0AAN6W8M3_9PEZI|nr:Neuroligin-4, X-linked [Podospora setosa]
MCWPKSIMVVAAALAHGAQALFIGGGLTILSLNILDGAENDKSAAVLINQPSPNYAASMACQLLGEEPWNPKRSNFTAALATSLPYQAYLGVVPQDQLYWISKTTPSADECRAIDATGKARNVDCSRELPTLCSQSARVSNRTVDDTSPNWQVQQFVGWKLVTGYRDLHVWKFRGLRYADPPKRFANSQVANYEEDGEVDATKAGADCSQPIGEVRNGSSEDCLFANVWTPYLPRMADQDKKEQLKPVMLYLYGGGLTSGSGKNPNTDGTNLASRGDVVVVSVNYRVGSLGFLNLNDGVHNGNYAISDMVTALEWVHKYIKYFGGDPNKVTLFGESAGALGTHVVLSSPKAKGLFHRAILQSSPDGYPSPEKPINPAPFYDTLTHNYETTTKKVLKDAGCLDAKDKIACLSKLSGFDLVNLPTNANGIVQDGLYLTTPALNFSSSLTSHIPIMLGITRDEAGVMIDDPPVPNTTFTQYFNTAAQKHFSLPANSTSLFSLPSTTLSLSNNETAILNSTISLLSSLIFTCPSLSKAYSASRHNTFGDTYYFLFNRTYQTSGYTRDWCRPPSTNGYPKGILDMEYYKCHAGEQMIVFGTVARGGLPDRDGNDFAFERLVVDYWGGFARWGKPEFAKGYLEVRGFEGTKREVERLGRWEGVDWKQPRLRVLQWGGRGGMVGFGEQANVSYLLLERRAEIAPQVGASIGIFSSGARILDQLGAWKRIEETAERINLLTARRPNGSVICEDKSTELILARTGYWTSWGERQVLLQALMDNVKDRSKILTGRHIVEVKHDMERGVTVVCENGEEFEGDVLVGCDGVNSKVREKMWQLAESEIPEVVREERNSLFADHNTLFGIAYGVEGLTPGHLDTAYNIGRVGMTIVAEEGKVYWFSGERLSRRYYLGEIPRFGEEEVKSYMARHGDLILRPGPNPLTLADLWKKTVVHRLVPIEQGKFKLWHWGRITCAGDSIHKSTPNLGVGANLGIESAATLANGIKKLADKCARTRQLVPSMDDVQKLLADYQQEREIRAAAAVDASGFLTQAHCMQTPYHRFFVHWMLPNFGELIAELFHHAMIGATKIDYLPLPRRSLMVNAPFNPAQGDGRRESKLKRAVLGLPLLLLACLAFYIMNIGLPDQAAKEQRDGGFLTVGNTTVPILRSFYGLGGFDDTVAWVNMIFVPGMYGVSPEGRRHMITFLLEGVPFFTIWLLESTRRANALTILQLPNLFLTLCQLLGVGIIAPLYLYLHYILSPVENFAARDKRLTNTRQSYATLPAILLAYLIPLIGLLFSPNLKQRQSWLFIWQPFPVWVSLATFALSRLFKDTVSGDKISNTAKDLPVLRGYVGLASLLAAAAHIWGKAGGYDYAGMGLFLPGGIPRRYGDLTEFAVHFLRWDYLFGLGTHVVWLGYLFGDLAKARMLKEGWGNVMAVVVVGVLTVGPGATVGGAWLFREEVLARRWHRDAVMAESVGRLHGESK